MMVRSVGIEPTQVCTHMPLKHACLPVPPRPHLTLCRYFVFSAGCCAGMTGSPPVGACCVAAPPGPCAVFGAIGNPWPCKMEEGEKFCCFSARSLSSDLVCFAEGCERNSDMRIHNPMNPAAKPVVNLVRIFAVSCVPNMLLAPASPPPMAPEIPPPLSD